MRRSTQEEDRALTDALALEEDLDGERGREDGCNNAEREPEATHKSLQSPGQVTVVRYENELYQVVGPNPSGGAVLKGVPAQSAVSVKTVLPHQLKAAT